LEVDAHRTTTHSSLSATAQLAKLQDQSDSYARRIEIEKRRIEDLDKQVKTLNQKILEQRTRIGGVNAARENNLKVPFAFLFISPRPDDAPDQSA
jgi:predicted  nucleic acid-binding Zn-ribbon protein